ncbi:MAG: hypothetical protein QOF69_611 [Solirubrobacteraceae bacterium]|nr:hypothetical protein [Solirubrobacteraceae bacterium]
MRAHQILLGFGGENDDLDLGSPRELLLRMKSGLHRVRTMLIALLADELTSTAVVHEKELRHCDG